MYIQQISWCSLSPILGFFSPPHIFMKTPRLPFPWDSLRVSVQCFPKAWEKDLRASKPFSVPWGICFHCNLILNTNTAPLEFSSTGARRGGWWGEWGRGREGRVKTGGPDKQETEDWNLLATKGSRDTMSFLFPRNIKSSSSFEQYLPFQGNHFLLIQ